LDPGKLSLHHIGIVYGSNVNRSNKPRIGIAVRYLTPEVKQDGIDTPFALLVRGRDDFGHFELLQPPLSDEVPPDDMIPGAVQPMMKNVTPQGWQLAARASELAKGRRI
jgi:hypothetical protein